MDFNKYVGVGYPPAKTVKHENNRKIGIKCLITISSRLSWKSPYFGSTVQKRELSETFLIRISMIILCDKHSTSGVYKIRNVKNNKIYIGSTIGKLIKRCIGHRTQLRYNIHANRHLQRAWNKWGEENFEFSILESCSKNKTIEREQHYMDTLKPNYNILKFAGGGILGYRHTQKTKNLIASLQSGRKHHSYIDDLVFYRPDRGHFIGTRKEFSEKFKLRLNGVNKLSSSSINHHKGWICLGNKSNYIELNDMKLVYRLKRNSYKKYYAFYNESLGGFIGTFIEFLKKYRLKSDNIKGIVSKKRNSASGWICMGECDLNYVFPENIKQIYKKRLSVNNRIKDMTHNVYTFSNGDENHNLSVKDFCEKFFINMVAIKRVCRGVRRSHLGWFVKN